MKITFPLLFAIIGFGSSGLFVQSKASVNSIIPSLQCQQAVLSAINMGAYPNMIFCREEQKSKQAEAKTISAQQFLDLSIKYSPLMQSQANLVDSAVYSLKSANANWWPNVSMSNSSLLFVKNTGNNNPNVDDCSSTQSSPATAGKSFNPFNGSSRSGSSSSCSASSQYTQAYPVITVTWNFINPSRYPQIAGAKKSISLAQSQLRQTQQQLQLTLLKSYGTYLLSGYQLGELASLIKIETNILNSTRRLVENRVLPRYLRNQEGRNLLAYQARIEPVLAMQKQAEAELSSALEKATPADRLSLPDLSSLVLKQWNYDDSQTLQMALKNSESLKQLALQSGIATDGANQLRGTILPTIGFLGYSTYQGTDSAGAYSGLLSNYVGLSLSWNLFNGYLTKYQAIASDKQALSYNQQQADSERQLRLLIQTKLISLKSLKRQINLYLNDINHTQSISNDLSKREKFGLSTTLDVLQAKQNEHESKLQLISALTSYVMIYTELSFLCGVDPLT